MAHLCSWPRGRFAHMSVGSSERELLREYASSQNTGSVNAQRTPPTSRYTVTSHHSGKVRVISTGSQPLSVFTRPWKVRVRSGPNRGGSMPAHWPVRAAVVCTSAMPGHTVSISRPAVLLHIGTTWTGRLRGSRPRALQ